MIDIINIIQDHSRPSTPDEDEAPTKILKNSWKKRSWTWNYFEEIDTEEQTGDKGEPLKRCKILDINGKKCEPYENLVVDVPQEFASKVIDLVSRRKGEMLIMETKGEMQHLEFEIPSRGLIGLRTQMLTATTGEAVMAHRFTEYKPWKGPIPGRNNGVLLSKNTDRTTGYSIDKLQDRGSFFVDPGEEVYAGQIIAENIKPGDLVVNATEPKKLTNHRASGSDDATRIQPKTVLSLEECMEYIQQDECIEVTPNFIRMRKVLLNEDERKKVQKRMESEAV